MSGLDRFAAVDLGASSGRIYLGHVDDHGLQMNEVHRFPNGAVPVLGHLYWDILGIYRGVLDGLRAAGGGSIASVGIDSWGVDYGLLGPSGELFGNPFHYRDRRTAGTAAAVCAQLGAAALYRRNGVAQLPFSTVFQLLAEGDRLAAARTLLLIPDLLAYWLTGERVCELTNASTTGLLRVLDPPDTEWRWDAELLADLHLPEEIFAPLVLPGQPIGAIRADAAEGSDLPGGTPVVAVASHDTASAVVAVPAGPQPFAYLSSGTWSLFGMELDRPVRTEAARVAGFTNEIGVDGTVRFQRNVMGLWLLQECQRSWGGIELAALLDAAGRLAVRRWLVDVDDPLFLPPGAMPDRLAAACARYGGPVPTTPAEVTRCILDSLAVAYRRVLDDARTLCGHAVQVVHLVGGGSQNALLCQLTADACGVPVVAGPVEAAAAGNILVQARAAGTVLGDLADLRALVRAGQPLRCYEPSGPESPWLDAAASLSGRGLANPAEVRCGSH